MKKKKEALNNHFRRESEWVKNSPLKSDIWATVQAEPPKILYFLLSENDNGTRKKDSSFTLNFFTNFFIYVLIVGFFCDHYFLFQIDNKTNEMSL